MANPWILIGDPARIETLLEGTTQLNRIRRISLLQHQADEGLFPDIAALRLIEPPDNLPSALLRLIRLHRAKSGGILLTRVDRPIRLVVFDLDGTLTPRETITDLATLIQRGECAERMNRRAMEGYDDFTSNFTERIAMLNGLPMSAVERYAWGLPFFPDMASTMQYLQEHGIARAILTGGCSTIAHICAQRLGIETWHATNFAQKEGLLTGQFAGSLVDPQAKASHLFSLCHQMGIPLEDSLAVGDGANDIPMLIRAGGLALGHFNPFTLLKQLLSLREDLSTGFND